MSAPNDGGPAYPTDTRCHDGQTAWTERCGGMSLRDYFAGQALAGLNAVPESNMTAEDEARWAYASADAMLKERQRKETK